MILELSTSRTDRKVSTTVPLGLLGAMSLSRCAGVASLTGRITDRMFCLSLLTLLCCSVTIRATPILQSASSSSGEFGGRGGERFTHTGNQLDGAINAFRIHFNLFHITGIQVRYGDKWSDHVGSKVGKMEEFFLFPGESIVQVAGRYQSFVNRLEFTTDQGRQFSFGRDGGTTFNAIPLFPGTVLRFISGRYGRYIDAISFHWDYSSSSPAGNISLLETQT